MLVGYACNAYADSCTSGNCENGKGVYSWSTGARYEGSFVKGDFNGRGKYIWPDGTRYDGEFMDGEMTGSGVMTWHNGNTSSGKFKNGILQKR